METPPIVDLTPWPLWDNPYRPGKIHPRPSRNPAHPYRAVLRVFGGDYAVRVPFLAKYRAEAVKRGRQIVREIESGKRPHPRRRSAPEARASMLEMRPSQSAMAPSVITFAQSQRAFTEAKLQIRPADAADRILRRRHAVTVRQYVTMWRAIFPRDAVLTNETLSAAVTQWNAHPVGVETARDPVTGTDTPLPLAEATVDCYLSRLRAYIRFCIARQWVTVNPLDGLGKPVVQKVSEPKVKSMNRQQRRRFMREVIGLARGPRIQRLKPEDMRQLPDFVRLLGLCGLRIMEAATIRLEAYATDPMRENILYDDVLVLCDTKNAHRKKRVGARVIPFRQFPYLAAVLDRQRSHAHRHDGYLFAWHTTSKSQRLGDDYIKPRIERAGVTGRFDRYHLFRSIASTYYQEELQLPRELVGILFGHSARVNEANYVDEDDRIRQEAAVLTTEIARHLRS